MKKSFAQKHPYIAAILTGLLCTFLTALGMAVPQVMKLETDSIYIVATIFLVISIVTGIIIMSCSRSMLSEYGMRKSEYKSNRKVLWYAPLLMLEILPIAFVGFSSEIAIKQYVIFIFFTIAVGMNEELYFRGLILKFLEGKGKKSAIIWSSVIFGVLHLVNAFNGKNIIYLVLQVLFAFLVGLVLAEIVSITKSLWGVIAWHAVHDYISFTTSESLQSKELIILAIQVTVLLVYAICIWKRCNEEDKVDLVLAD